VPVTEHPKSRAALSTLPQRLLVLVDNPHFYLAFAGGKVLHGCNFRRLCGFCVCVCIVQSV
jgi:hypothetical protein